MFYVPLDMKKVPRLIKFPYQVCSVGYYNETESITLYRKYERTIEFCLRLSATKDSATDIINGQKYITPYPHLIIKAPGMEHTYDIDDQRNAFYIMYPADLIPALTDIGIVMQPFLMELTNLTKILSLIDNLKLLISNFNEPGIADEIDIQSFNLLHQLSLMLSGVSTRESREKKKIRQIATYIQLHFRENICINELISKNGFSKSSFFRYWNEDHDISPLQYIINLRLAESRRLVAETDLSIDEITYKLSMNYPSYFVKQFKNKYGITPLQYRKKVNQ